MQPCSGGGQYVLQSPPVPPLAALTQWWVHPRPVRLTFGPHACHLPRYPVVKTLEGLIQPGDQDPRLGPKQEYCLHHRHIEPPLIYLIRYHPFQRFLSAVPISLRPPDVTFHCRPIVISGQHNFPKDRNEENYVSGVPYSEKTRPIYSYVSSASNLLHFLSVPRRHIAEVGCDQLRASCRKKGHTGGTGGGSDYPPPGRLCCLEGVGRKSVPRGLYARTLSLGTPPHGTSIGQG